MNEKEDHKGFLKEKFKGYHVDPPESVWTSISARLGGKDRRGLVIVILAVAATIALAVALGINYFGKRDPGQGKLSEMPQGEKELLQVPQATIPEKAPASERATSGKEGMNGRDELASQERSVPEVAIEVPGTDLALVPEENAGTDLELVPEENAGTDLALVPEENAGTDLELVPEENAGTDLALVPEEDTGPDLEQMPEENAETDLALKPEVPLEQEEWAGENGEKKARWMVGAALSPLYSFRDADAGAIGAGEDFESGLISYAGGIQVSYRAAKRFAIESGVFFNRMGISIGASGIRMFDSSLDAAPMAGASDRSNWVAVTNSIGNIVSSSGDIFVNGYLLAAESQSDSFYELTDNQEVVTAEEGIRQRLDYLELPMNVRYSVVDRTFELQLVGGMSANFLLNNYITMDTPSGTQEIGYLTNIRSVNYSGNAGLGMIYHLRSKISLRLEPRFRYFLNSVNDATLPSTRPYSLGLYTGFSITF